MSSMKEIVYYFYSDPLFVLTHHQNIAIIMFETRNCLFSINSDLVIHLFTCKSCLQFRVWL